MTVHTSTTGGGAASPLERALIGARVIESAENYARAAVPLPPPAASSRNAASIMLWDDEQFWRDVLRTSGSSWGSRVDFADVAILSEWVARVPGLYWKPESARLREVMPDAIEGQDLGGVTLRPYGKSRVVVGGVGTLRLPPSAQGFRLCSVTVSANVSTGIPALVSPEVWDHHRLAEGALVRVARPGEVSWQQMPIEWSSRFPSTRGLPLGCLMLTNPDAVAVVPGRGAAQIHPYTIMEYTDGAAELFDFVFATGNTGDPESRKRLEAFFESYRRRAGRQGRYLIAADIADPLWDALYTGPQELTRADVAAESHLTLLERRVQARLLGSDTETPLLQALASLPDLDFLRRLSTQVGIPPGTWYTGGSLADAAAQFLARVNREQLPAVVEALAIEHPPALAAA